MKFKISSVAKKEKNTKTQRIDKSRMGFVYILLPKQYTIQYYSNQVGNTRLQKEINRIIEAHVNFC